MVAKAQPIDSRHVRAGQLLGLPPEQIAVQCGFIGADLLYAWDKPLGRTVIVDAQLNAQEFDPGVLLPKARDRFQKAHVEKEAARGN